MGDSDTSKAAGGEQGGASCRRAGIGNLFAVLKHINEASGEPTVRQRYSDYVTLILVLACILSMVAAVALPISIPIAIKLMPLGLTVGAVIFHIVNRLGIVISLSHRQALIVWQILIASFWLGVTSSMLVMLICMYYINQGMH